MWGADLRPKKLIRTDWFDAFSGSAREPGSKGVGGADAFAEPYSIDFCDRSPPTIATAGAV